MSNPADRILSDSLGQVEVPVGAFYGAQTQRAIQNFTISPFRFPRSFLAALGLIKKAAAIANRDLGLLDSAIASAIVDAAGEVQAGRHDSQFPVDVFQTGSGTSTNMNANEVIASLAAARCGRPVHANDHVNLGQSSNDVIPAAIHLSAVLEIDRALLPALDRLAGGIAGRKAEFGDAVKTGRTHWMDAVPMRVADEWGAWESQIRTAAERISDTRKRALELPLGGTAIGSGLNAHPDFGGRAIQEIARESGAAFLPSRNPFAAIATQETALEMSSQLRVLAAALLKICGDLRAMNSGPVNGLAEISLAALQPGSSIMPGKVNPVIPEAVSMACAQVMGNDAAILIGAQSGVFQLNTMLPLIAWNLLGSIHLLAGSAEALHRKAIAGLQVNLERLRERASRNPILATALAPRIGYDASAEIAKEALRSGRSVLDVARERQTGISEEELRALLDPANMARPGATS